MRLLICLTLLSLPAFAQPKMATVSAELNYSAAEPGQEALLAVIIDVGPGFHAQSHTPKDPSLIALTVTPDSIAGVTFGEPEYPAGHDETYPDLGTVNVYTGKTRVYVPVKIAADARPGKITLSGKVRYQICDDKVCFAPESPKWSADVNIVQTGPVSNPQFVYTGRATSKPSPATNPSGAPPVSAGDERENYSFLVAMAIAFGAGLLFNVMPCVLPLLPLKAMSFYEVAAHHRGRTVLFALAFSAGIIATFGVLAVVVIVTKKLGWSELFSRWWFIWSVVVILLGFSLSMFGLFTVNVPSSMYQFSPRHDNYLGNFLFGVLAVVLSTPCTAPMLPGLIVWAQFQTTIVGVIAMLMVGVGMAFPYVILSLFPQAARNFPRVGPWSELIKQMMGFLLLGSAVFFASTRLFSSSAFWWSITPVAAVASLYLVARTVQLTKSAQGVAIASTLAVLMTSSAVWIAAYMNGAFEPRATTASTGADTIAWQKYSDDLIEKARGQNIVLVKFTANWCLNCQAIEAAVFRGNPETAAAIKKYGVVTVKADLSDDDAPGWPRLRTLNKSGGIPLTAVYVPGYDQPVQLTSIYKTHTLLKVLEQAAQASKTAALK